MDEMWFKVECDIKCVKYCFFIIDVYRFYIYRCYWLFFKKKYVKCLDDLVYRGVKIFYLGLK